RSGKTFGVAGRRQPNVDAEFTGIAVQVQVELIAATIRANRKPAASRSIASTEDGWRKHELACGLPRGCRRRIDCMHENGRPKAAISVAALPSLTCARQVSCHPWC